MAEFQTVLNKRKEKRSSIEKRASVEKPQVVQRQVSKYLWCGFVSQGHERWFAEYPNGKLVTIPGRVVEAEIKKNLFS